MYNLGSIRHSLHLGRKECTGKEEFSVIYLKSLMTAVLWQTEFSQLPEGRETSCRKAGLCDVN